MNGQDLERQESTILMMDHMLREQTSLATADTRIDEFINLGRNALNELYEQRSMLKVPFS
jgi:Golgi SNAP receptor complex protein 2